MAKEKEESAVFEVVVVLAIVAIVALTGQVLLNLDNTGSSFSLGEGGITGFVTAGDDSAIPKEDYVDVGVDEIEVSPASPLVGEPFSIKVTLLNDGFEKITTPFYVEAKIIPPGEDVKPTKIYRAVTQSFSPGEKVSLVFNVAMVTSEGPVRIVATADYTFKLGDANPSNDFLSKTIVISNQ